MNVDLIGEDMTRRETTGKNTHTHTVHGDVMRRWQNGETMMASPAVRSIAAVVVGVLIAVLVISVVEMAGHLLFPPPAGFDLTNPADRARLIDAIPLGAMAAVVIAWFLGSLTGASTAIAIAHRVLPAWTVGLIIAALGLWTTQTMPHPNWMVIAAMVLPLVAVLIAKRLMAERLAP